MMMRMKGYDQALKQARGAQAIAERTGDRDFAVLAISMQGFVAVYTGDFVDGMRLLDEALAAAVAGELGPFATAEIFCEMIVSCLELTDFQRAAKWLETAERAGRQIVCFPGCCRTHRATVLRHRGQWDEAHSQAHQARTELVGVEAEHEGMALCEMGELYRPRLSRTSLRRCL